VLIRVVLVMCKIMGKDSVGTPGKMTLRDL